MVAVFTGQDERAGCHKRAFSRGLKRSINEGLAIRQLRGATVAGFIFGACNASLWKSLGKVLWPNIHRAGDKSGSQKNGKLMQCSYLHSRGHRSTQLSYSLKLCMMMELVGIFIT